jgi:hypothetical protein
MNANYGTYQAGVAPKNPAPTGSWNYDRSLKHKLGIASVLVALALFASEYLKNHDEHIEKVAIAKATADYAKQEAANAKQDAAKARADAEDAEDKANEAGDKATNADRTSGIALDAARDAKKTADNANKVAQRAGAEALATRKKVDDDHRYIARLEAEKREIHSNPSSEARSARTPTFSAKPETADYGLWNAPASSQIFAAGTEIQVEMHALPSDVREELLPIQYQSFYRKYMVVMSEAERERFLGLRSDSERIDFVGEFLERMDLATASLLDYAEAHFRSTSSDRGRILLKEGIPPQTIGEGGPVLIWIYPGKRFKFYRSDGGDYAYRGVLGDTRHLAH